MCEGEFCVQRWVLLRIMVATNNHKIDFIYFFNLSASLCRLITSAGWRGGDDKAQTLNIHLPGKPSQTVLSPWPLLVIPVIGGDSPAPADPTESITPSQMRRPSRLVGVMGCALLMSWVRQWCLPDPNGELLLRAGDSTDKQSFSRIFC